MEKTSGAAGGTPFAFEPGIVKEREHAFPKKVHVLAGGRSVSKTTRRSSDATRRGNALVLSLVCVIVCAVLAGAFIQVAQATTRRQTQALHLKEAFYAAEAGLAEAYSGLVGGLTGNVGSATAPAVFGKGLFWVEVIALGKDLLSLESTGMVGTGRARLSLVVEKGETSVASLGVFSVEPMMIPPGTRIDGFDSAEGTLTSARVGSNGDVRIEAGPERPVVIMGDVTPGPQHQVIATENVFITGSQEPSAASPTLPPVNVPPVELGSGLSHSDAVPLLIAPGTTGVEYLRVGAGGKVTVVGPATVVVGEVQLDSNAQLTLDAADGRVDLFVTKALNIATGAFLETTSTDPGQISIQVQGETENPVQLLGQAEFYGVLYVPQAVTVISKDFEVFGALIAGKIQFSGPAKLHFDQHLTELAAESLLPTLVSWRIVNLGVSSTNFNKDPFDVLGVDRASLPLPGDAHGDVWIDIVYVDLAGNIQSYEGWHSSFGWENVDSTLYYASYTDSGGDLLLERAAGDDDEEELDPADAALLTLIFQSPPMNSSDLKTALLDASPCSDLVLESAIDRPAPMNTSHLKDVLLQNGPLSEAILMAALDRTMPMSSSDLKAVLLANSPLPPSIRSRVVSDQTPLSVSDKTSVMAAN